MRGKNVWVVACIACILLLAGCVQEAVPSSDLPGEASPRPPPEKTGSPPESQSAPAFLKGVSLSPKSFSADDFTAFFEYAGEAGNTVLWAGDWMELGDLESGSPAVVAQLAQAKGYTPIIEASVFSDPGPELLRPLDAKNKERYKEIAVAFAKKFHPPYMGFGIEINRLYESSPSDFEEFTGLYGEVFAAVKAVSPQTKVFSVFQLEKMKGLTFWASEPANPEKAQWDLLEKFDADLTVFTTYPGLVFKAPSEIPKDYYDEVLQHVFGPVAFTEMGWHSRASPDGWEGSEPEQAEFVTTFFDLSKNLDKKIVIWSFLFDPATIEPFDSMGLRRNDGSARPAWNVWVSAKG